jgi:hypothetical protein
MLLGALVDAGVELGLIASAVESVVPGAVSLHAETVSRTGLRARRVRVEVADGAPHRSWRDIRTLVESAGLDEATKGAALATFEALARAEGAVHGIDPDEVHFHEVGALDSIADVVGVCRGFAALGAEDVVVSAIAVGSGRVSADHGSLPVPVPAVMELLRGRAVEGGPGEGESCTPTGAALLGVLATAQGSLPTMKVERVGVGAGGRDPASHPNVLRLLVGTAVTLAEADDRPLVIEANVDDMDPRLWPDVLSTLFAAGASDAWLTPILMKKGRPAHTLSVLTSAKSAAPVREAVFRHTSTIGVREVRVSKTALEREFVRVDVSGIPVAVKVARMGGEVVNAQPEYDDVVRAATTLGRPVKEVLAEAVTAWRRGLG